ncbi:MULTISPECIES: MarC family protein [Roseobacteraceae]|uniref:MarC family protein n=1 Tax=Roseobacteraceae TaxID=2854170 RepID=UPI0013BAB3A5|nr:MULTISPECIES: MarC family protein [Roseobacteraceae]MCA0994521.1 MarC family protein [Alloyangia pacifica]NDV99509.1 MarC family protein [Salipiger sp. PrR002]NDW57155.1 MarC family protein [Salipiger sp. PrR004]
MDMAFLISAFATLFVVIDPIGLTPVFIALTQGADSAHRRAVGIRACITALVILMLFAFFGEAVLGFIGISMPAFRISGGLLLFLTALDMLFERRTKRREDKVEDEVMPDPSVFPIAIPLIAGPGAIASIILLMGQSDGALETAMVLGVLGIVLLMVLGCFLVAGPMERALGHVGIVVITRLFGMLLAALSVQFVIDGIRGIDWSGVF